MHNKNLEFKDKQTGLGLLVLIAFEVKLLGLMGWMNEWIELGVWMNLEELIVVVDDDDETMNVVIYKLFFLKKEVRVFEFDSGWWLL